MKNKLVWLWIFVVLSLGINAVAINKIITSKSKCEELELVYEYQEKIIRELTLENDELAKNYMEVKSKYEWFVDKYNELESEYNEVRRIEDNVSREIRKRTLLGTFEATAYSDDPQSQGKWVGQTASGMKPQVGVVAVDPKVIPLGTKLFIEGYGQAIAGDVGGAIKGKRIDVFLPDKDSCMKWGRKKVKVWKIN